jgi:hypothetical protein
MEQEALINNLLHQHLLLGTSTLVEASGLEEVTLGVKDDDLATKWNKLPTFIMH